MASISPGLGSPVKLDQPKWNTYQRGALCRRSCCRDEPDEVTRTELARDSALITSSKGRGVHGP